MLYYIFSKKLNEKNRSNRNVDLEKNFKEKLARIHPEILFGEVLIKV